MQITASTLYNYTQCKHKVWRDKHGPQNEKDPEPNQFVKLLWEKGILHEQKIIQKLGKFEDISKYPYKQRQDKTLEALNSGADLIYQGIIAHDNLLGIPDLLRKTADNKYIAIDIKSGRGFEGVNEDEGDPGKPKKHYALQICLYTDILERLKLSAGRTGLVLDITSEEVEYLLNSPMGTRTPQTFWEYYLETKDEVSLLLQNKQKNTPALSGICKLCQWYSSCKNWIKDNDDLSQIYYIGRSVRDTISSDLHINSVDDFLEVDLQTLLTQKQGDKSFLKGLGPKKLQQATERARIFRTTKEPVIRETIDFPEVEYELFFDIEADPTQDHVYLHGMLEVHNGQDRFIPFLAKKVDPAEEKRAWSEFWDYITEMDDKTYSVYYYGSYEKTTFNQLYKKYPDVVNKDVLDAFFDNKNVIDLYNQVIMKHTDWPLSSYSIKEIAVYLGFSWSDKSPSGALSIKWYNDYVKSGDEKILNRILKYNEDDCRATQVVKEGIEKLQR